MKSKLILLLFYLLFFNIIFIFINIKIFAIELEYNENYALDRNPYKYLVGDYNGDGY